MYIVTYTITEIKPSQYGYMGYYSEPTICRLTAKPGKFDVGDVIVEEHDATHNIRILWRNGELISENYSQESYNEFHGQMYETNERFRKAIDNKY